MAPQAQYGVRFYQRDAQKGTEVQMRNVNSQAPPGSRFRRLMLACITTLSMMLLAMSAIALPPLPIDYPDVEVVGASPSQSFQPVLTDVQQQGNNAQLEEVGFIMSSTDVVSMNFATMTANSTRTCTDFCKQLKGNDAVTLNTGQDGSGFVVALPKNDDAVEHHLIE
ncbi:MAG: hypothetical protein A3C15_02205 [Candidatus Magasanikbacteria bacterium RIFCSPHIGHO2_02_FULL_50_9b]|uniref:Uncharacterized protein n=1 Tax=Candidatus Magasanikbacteria bacterium RIFCSPHIGHO2_02_FULL_50_9b TaxID=1798682 RepID=A0A1F6M891_9BACT|nr:MAG: hypothetical protein A3C15_02205 [Candidatus Magasanikbacteria bacterium RIFCSPHIGHO2_02_FULL_50_9b]